MITELRTLLEENENSLLEFRYKREKLMRLNPDLAHSQISKWYAEFQTNFLVGRISKIRQLITVIFRAKQSHERILQLEQEIRDLRANLSEE